MLLRDHFNSFNFYKNDELSRNQIGRSGVQVNKENEKFTPVRSRSPQNLECGHFTLLATLSRDDDDDDGNGTLKITFASSE